MKSSTVKGVTVVVSAFLGRMVFVIAVAYWLIHLQFGYPPDVRRIEIGLATGAVLLAAAASINRTGRWLLDTVIGCCAMAGVPFVAAIIKVYFARTPPAFQGQEMYSGILASGFLGAACIYLRRKSPKRHRHRTVPLATAIPPMPPRAAILHQHFGVATSTYVVIGIISAIFLLPGISGLVSGTEPWAGLALCAAGAGAFWHFCFQSVELDHGLMVIRRPLAPTQRMPLASVTEVCSVWSNSGSYRRVVFKSGNEILGSFNPKLYSLEGLACILEEVRLHAPAAIIDRDTSAFLARATKTTSR